MFDYSVESGENTNTKINKNQQSNFFDCSEDDSKTVISWIIGYYGIFSLDQSRGGLSHNKPAAGEGNEGVGGNDSDQKSRMTTVELSLRLVSQQHEYRQTGSPSCKRQCMLGLFRAVKCAQDEGCGRLQCLEAGSLTGSLVRWSAWRHMQDSQTGILACLEVAPVTQGLQATGRGNPGGQVFVLARDRRKSGKVVDRW